MPATHTVQIQTYRKNSAWIKALDLISQAFEIFEAKFKNKIAPEHSSTYSKKWQGRLNCENQFGNGKEYNLS